MVNPRKRKANDNSHALSKKNKIDVDVTQIPRDIWLHTLSFLDDESYKNIRISSKFFKSCTDYKTDFEKRKLHSHCIKQIACGKRTLYLLNNGTLWQENEDGQGYQKINLDTKIKKVFIDENSSLDIFVLLDENGSIWCYGNDIFLICSSLENLKKLDLHKKIIHIVLKHKSCFLLTEDKQVIVCGINSSYQLGLSPPNTQNLDIITAFSQCLQQRYGFHAPTTTPLENVKNIFSDGYITLFILNDNHIFGCGDNEEQYFTGLDKNLLPSDNTTFLTELYSPGRVKSIVFLNQEALLFLLCEDGTVWQSGLDLFIPLPINNIEKMFGNSHHVLFLDNNESVYYLKAGLLDNINPIVLPESIKIKNIHLVNNYAFLIDQEGRVWWQELNVLNKPVAIPNLENVETITGQHTLYFIKKDNTVGYFYDWKKHGLDHLSGPDFFNKPALMLKNLNPKNQSLHKEDNETRNLSYLPT